MPILPPEPSQYPENLFQVEFDRFARDRRWWVLQTRPRAEKQLARRLLKQEVPFFLPLYAQRRRIQRRQVSSQLPLFPGYLFMLADEEERSWAHRTDLIVNCLSVADQSEIDSDISQIHRLIESNEPISPVPRLEPGILVEIVSGPLEGQRGIVVRHGASMRVIISVNFLQQGASVEVPCDFVQRI